MSEEKEPYGSDKEKNMSLWDAVSVTDPATTTKVNVRGGFTAIAAQSQLKNATALWGSYGKAWGVKACRYTHIYITGKDDVSKPIEVMLTAVFYYPGGEFEIATDIAFSTGGDSCKKLLTDLTTKALSKLGFNSDVFEGRFDDCKYVESLTAVKEHEPITEKQIEEIDDLKKKLTMDEIKYKNELTKSYKKAATDRLDTKQADMLIVRLKTKLEYQKKGSE